MKKEVKSKVRNKVKIYDKYLEKLDKKGVSPVVATVILIAIVVVLGMIILLWAMGFFGEKAQKFDEPITKACDSINLEISYSGESLEVLNNDERIPLYKLRVNIEGAGGSEPMEVEANIGPGQSKSIPIDSGLTIKNVIPVLVGLSNGAEKEYVCTNRKIELS